MFFQSTEVNYKLPHNALEDFISFMSTFPEKPLFVGHNIKRLDCHVLYNALKSRHMWNEFSNHVCGFLDTLDYLKKLTQGLVPIAKLHLYKHFYLEQRATSHSNADADRVIRLWNSLAPFDQAPYKFRDNLKQQLIKGRFKAPKSTRVDLVPGVQSVKRCALAPHLGPAAWPDTNRYQEAFISRLCMAFPSSTSKDGRRQPRWKAVVDAYNRARIEQEEKKGDGEIGAGSETSRSPVCCGPATAPSNAKTKGLGGWNSRPHGFTVNLSTVGQSTKGNRIRFP
uniref:Uncharacterized protein n=1 Tax=Magallana gigas TaxID=29159 RepID=K1Q3C6_MAGGI